MGMRAVAVVATCCLLASACTPIVGRRTTASTVADVALTLAVASAAGPVGWCAATGSGDEEVGCAPELVYGGLVAAPLLVIGLFTGAGALQSKSGGD